MSAILDLKKESIGATSEMLYEMINDLMWAQTNTFGADRAALSKRAERFSKARTQLVNALKEWDN